MSPSLKESAAAAVRALQKWYAADSYASSTGLYHWSDPNFDSDYSPIEKVAIIGAGVRETVQDMETWWNSANAMTALIDYMLVTNDRTYLWAVENTFNKAQSAWKANFTVIGGSQALGAVAGFAAGAAYGAQFCGAPCAIAGGALGALGGFFGGGHAAASISIGRNYFTNFLNEFYDDNGWWALAWLKAYDLTGDRKYLDMATIIFREMTSGWDGVCGGGLYWQKNHMDSGKKGGRGPLGPYKNAIANELFLAVAAGICRRIVAIEPAAPVQEFIVPALNEWQWFSKISGMITGKNLVNDSDTQCFPDGTSGFSTANQGVILAALCDLSEITGNDPQPLAAAVRIADALILNQVNASQTESGVNAGILTEFADTDPDAVADTKQTIGMRQAKGIFVRNLAYLYKKVSKPAYRAFILKNKDSALSNMNASNQFGANWSAGVVQADFVRQSSALDLLNAALQVLHSGAGLSYLAPLLLQDEHAATDVSYLDPLLLD